EHGGEDRDAHDAGDEVHGECLDPHRQRQEQGAQAREPGGVEDFGSEGDSGQVSGSAHRGPAAVPSASAEVAASLAASAASFADAAASFASASAALAGAAAFAPAASFADSARSTSAADSSSSRRSRSISIA